MEASAETWTNTDIKNEAGLKRPGDVAEIREKLGHPDPKGRNLPWERQEILDFLKLSDQGMSEEAAIKEIVSHRSSATQHSGNGNGHHGLPPAEESKPQSGQLSQAINQGAANLGDVGRTLGRMGGAALTQNFVHEALSTGSQGIVEVTEQLKQRVEKELGQLIDVDAIPLEEGRINYLPDKL